MWDTSSLKRVAPPTGEEYYALQQALVHNLGPVSNWSFSPEDYLRLVKFRRAVKAGYFTDNCEEN